jgi:lipopolysaccharide biosynthesis regulator YciM
VALIAAYPFVRDYLKRKSAPAAAYTEGLTLILEGKDNEAIDKLRQAVHADSNNVDAYLRLADLYTKKGDTTKASAIFERLTVRRNVTVDEEKKVYLKLADYYIKTDRMQRAITLYEELLNLDRNNIVHYENLMSLYAKTERWSDCDVLLKKVEKIQTNKSKIAEYYAEYGKKLLAKSPEEAAKYFKQALSHNRKSVTALVQLGDYYYNKKETQLAIKIWNELLEYLPEHNYLVRGRLEQAYYDLGQYDEITNLYEKLLKKVPDDTGLYIALAQINEKKEELDSAIKVLSKIPLVKRVEPLPQIELAKLYLKHGDTNKAKQILETLVEKLKVKG